MSNIKRVKELTSGKYGDAIMLDTPCVDEWVTFSGATSSAGFMRGTWAVRLDGHQCSIAVMSDVFNNEYEVISLHDEPPVQPMISLAEMARVKQYIELATLNPVLAAQLDWDNAQPFAEWIGGKATTDQWGDPQVKPLDDCFGTIELHQYVVTSLTGFRTFHSDDFNFEFIEATDDWLRDLHYKVLDALDSVNQAKDDLKAVKKEYAFLSEAFTKAVRQR